LFIGSEAGFPASGTGESSVCGFLEGKPHEDCDVADLDRKSGAAEGSAIPRTIPGDVFDRACGVEPAVDAFLPAKLIPGCFSQE
jgi:hypothetical protein